MSEPRTYIVTGATGGLGKEITKALASGGGDPRVVIAVRNVEAGQRLADSLRSTGAELPVMRLDLASIASVDAMIEEFKATGWEIDGLINNAGAMPGEILITGDGHEMATQVNYIGTRRLTEGLLPMIKRGGAIVFTTSMTRHIARMREDWDDHAKRFKGLGRRFITYGRSKRMIAAFARELSAQLASRGVRVNCGDPGIADTGIMTMGNRVVDYLSDKIFRPFCNTPAQGAQGALRALDTDLTGYIFTPKGMTKNNFSL